MTSPILKLHNTGIFLIFLHFFFNFYVQFNTINDSLLHPVYFFKIIKMYSKHFEGVFHIQKRWNKRVNVRWNTFGKLNLIILVIFRRHYLQFPAGVLDQHYMKLLQSDKRLLELSRRSFPSSHSAYFNLHLDEGTTQFSIGHDLHDIVYPYSLSL